jgi:hypothetical protein
MVSRESLIALVTKTPSPLVGEGRGEGGDSSPGAGTEAAKDAALHTARHLIFIK